ncbi:MAG: hypothetical protein ABI877_17800, partial [Gemmatimonadaceae bacterium]
MGTWQSEFRLYTYDTDTTLAGVRRCMQGVAHAVATAVGVVVEITTSSGERMQAWSGRAFHEPHIAVPTRVTTSCQ